MNQSMLSDYSSVMYQVSSGFVGIGLSAGCNGCTGQTLEFSSYTLRHPASQPDTHTNIYTQPHIQRDTDKHSHKHRDTF